MTMIKNSRKKYFKALLTIIWLFSLISAVHSQAINTAQNTQIDNYKTRYTPQGRESVNARGTYSKDTHVWVYTSSFAKRFGMPQEWVDDELKGAEALAYRIDLDVYGTKCGYFGEVENCRPSTACVVDMYIDDKANLPWNNQTRYASRYGRKSKAFLFSQYSNDKPAYLYRRTKRGQQYKLGLDVVYVSGSKILLNNYYLLEYDRDIYKNLDYVSGSMTCRSFGKSRDIKIKINKPPLRDDGSIIYNKGKLAYAITIPNSFMQRIEAYDKAQYEPNSLFKALKKRLSTTTKKPNK